jgi:hypothetical protein
MGENKGCGEGKNWTWSVTTIPTEYITETELTAKNYLPSLPPNVITSESLSSYNYITVANPTIVDMKNYLFPSTSRTFTFTIKSNVLGNPVISGADRTGAFVDKSCTNNVLNTLYFNLGDTVKIESTDNTSGYGVGYQIGNVSVSLYLDGVHTGESKNVIIAKKLEDWIYPPINPPQYLYTFSTSSSTTQIIKIPFTAQFRTVKNEYYTKTDVYTKAEVNVLTPTIMYVGVCGNLTDASHDLSRM